MSSKRRWKRFPEEYRYCSLEALTHGAESVFCLVRAGVSSQPKSELLDYGKMRLQREVLSNLPNGHKLIVTAIRVPCEESPYNRPVLFLYSYSLS